MTLSRLLAAAISILALAGCGTTESSAPAGGTPPAETADSKPATEAAPPASDEALKSPPVSDKTDVKDAEAAPSPQPKHKPSRKPADLCR